MQIIAYFKLFLDQVSFYQNSDKKKEDHFFFLREILLPETQQLTWYMEHSYSLVHLGVMSLKLST